MAFYLEPIGSIDDIELDGVDISDVKVWKDETFTAEVDTSGWSKEHWQAIFGFIPIIRCKDCKFLRLTGSVWKCQNRLVMMLCEPNDYCSRAERKEQ